MAVQIAKEKAAKKAETLNSLLTTRDKDIQDADGGDFTWGTEVQAALDRLDNELIGLAPVKARVREMASMLVVDKMRQSIGLEPFIADGLHMCFTGSPGTGKTTVAFRMGDIFKAMGYSRRNEVVLATRDTLVGQYVGHTAPKTKEVIKQAMGGILFIDEAYYLYNASNDRDYGVDAIEILLKVMEERSEDLIVIFAGYKDRMDQFFSYIPGMQSRVNLHVDFPDMDTNDLLDVGKLMFKNMDYILDPEAEPALEEYVQKRSQKLFFSNARTVRNACDLARMASANRVYQAAVHGGVDEISLDELNTIKKSDFDGLLELINNAADDAILA
jgi:probable Rubsico expression protein CbbX